MTPGAVFVAAATDLPVEVLAEEVTQATETVVAPPQVVSADEEVTPVVVVDLPQADSADVEETPAVAVVPPQVVSADAEVIPADVGEATRVPFSEGSTETEMGYSTRTNNKVQLSS